MNLIYVVHLLLHFLTFKRFHLLHKQNIGQNGQIFVNPFNCYIFWFILDNCLSCDEIESPEKCNNTVECNGDKVNSFNRIISDGKAVYIKDNWNVIYTPFTSPLSQYYPLPPVICPNLLPGLIFIIKSKLYDRPNGFTRRKC